MTPELKSAVKTSLPLSNEVTGSIFIPSHQKLVPNKRKTQKSLCGGLKAAFGKKMMLYIIPKFNMTLCKIVMRLLMQILLKYVSNNPRSFPLKK